MKNNFQFKDILSPKSDPELRFVDGKDKSCIRAYGSDALHEPAYCRLTEEERALIAPKNDGEAWISQQPAGVQLHFCTDSQHIWAEVELQSLFDMTNMTQEGQCGADLYVLNEDTDTYEMMGTTAYPFGQQHYKVAMADFSQLPKKMRRCIVNLPLYKAIDSIKIGIDKDAKILPAQFPNDGRIVIYGTSIAQGCCASRPGMAYTNIVSRALKKEIINLGFSGVAFMEEEMAQIIAKKQMELLIIDTEPNAGVDNRLGDNCPKFLETFFEKQPQTPVLLFSRMPFAFDLYDVYRRELNAYYIKFMRNLAADFRKRGYNIKFVDQSNVFGKYFWEYTVDIIHPTDAGMIKIAEFYLKQISAMLK